MIGIIISGHGNFATGIASSLKLVSGGPANVEYVDFLEADSIDNLKEKYKIALDNLKDCNNILALTDLAGGSPFKTLVELSTEVDKQIKVVAGTNLPMALEITMLKDIIEDLSSLVDSALEAGKNGVVKFEIVEKQEKEFEDGI